MQEFENFDWHQGSAEEHLAMARLGSADQICDLARNYSWFQHPEKVLGWIMAQKCVDLGTALTVFLNGEPERFNYMPKRDVPEGYRGVVRLLDNICQRINSGFYLADPNSPLNDRRRVSKWLDYQTADHDEGHLGRWQLDSRILDPLLNDTLRLEVPEDQRKQPNLLLEILSPAIDLATKRVIEDEPEEATPAEMSQAQRG
ncbi:hypothetical protein AAFO92_12435 [Roseovarius sp. CAU 1744]|uniref:hypothetical protein n=1 Tax=Roseovarius sp. CAU 1744 TaxID=3140368 RepID=UPI00325C3036